MVEFIKANGYPLVERRAQQGINDRGDIANVPHTVIEAKSLKTLEMAASMDEMMKERLQAKARWGAVFFKRARKGSAGEGYAVLPVALFMEMIRELEGQ